MVATKKPALSTAKAAKPTPGGAFMKPMTPSVVLAAVVGASPLSRTEVTKKVWDYIKAHAPQDAANKRMINADDRLKEIFGGRTQVSMLEMPKLINAHLK
jgi:chromatin remodeling complex protein RSC6